MAQTLRWMPQVLFMQLLTFFEKVWRFVIALFVFFTHKENEVAEKQQILHTKANIRFRSPPHLSYIMGQTAETNIFWVVIQEVNANRMFLFFMQQMQLQVPPKIYFFYLERYYTSS